MADIYVSKSGNNSNSGADWDNAKLTIAGALAIESNGDNIYIGAGTYTETIKAQSGVSGINLSFIGATGNPEDVIITNSGDGGGGHGVVSCASGCSISHCTIIYTGTSVGISAFSVSTYGGGTATNCIIKSSVWGVELYGSATLDRCQIICTHKGTSTATTGIDGQYGGSSVATVYSCLVQDFNTNGINVDGRGHVINCTVQTDYQKTAGKGIYAANVYNCIYNNNSGGDQTYGIHGTTIKNCISYGVDGDDDFHGTETACLGYDDITTDTFAAHASDNFRPGGVSKAVGAGTYDWQTAQSAPTTDITNRAYASTGTTIGCYQYIWVGGSKFGGTANTSLGKIMGSSVATVGKVMGIG